MPPSSRARAVGALGEMRRIAVVMDSVLHLGAETGGAFGGEPDLDPFHSLHRHDGLGEPSVEAGVPGNVRAEPRRKAMGHHFKDTADRVARAVGFVDHFLHSRLGGGIDAAQQNLVALAQLHHFLPVDRTFHADGTDRDDVAEHPDSELPEQRLGQSADRHSRRGLPGAGAFEDVTGIVKIVLDGAGQVGMSRPGTGDRPPFIRSAVGVLHRESFSPVLPVLIPDENGDGGADGPRIPHTGHNFRAIGFDLHAAAAAVALLPPPQLPID